MILVCLVSCVSPPCSQKGSHRRERCGRARKTQTLPSSALESCLLFSKHSVFFCLSWAPPEFRSAVRPVLVVITHVMPLVPTVVRVDASAATATASPMISPFAPSLHNRGSRCRFAHCAQHLSCRCRTQGLVVRHAFGALLVFCGEILGAAINSTQTAIGYEMGSLIVAGPE